jgi:hypothetical protein
MLLKLGVRRIEDLSRYSVVLGRARKIDIRLYGEILRGHPEGDRWLPLILQSYRASNRAPKRTESGRFQEFDALLLATLAERAAPSPLAVHDMGVSDGRTAVELYEKLSERTEVEFNASDWYPELHLVRHRRRGWSVAFDEDGHAVQYAGFGFVLSPPEPDRAFLYPVNRLVQALFDRILAPRAARALGDSDLTELAVLEERRHGEFQVSRIPLVCRECLDLMEREPRFHYERHDVREPCRRRFHLIRAMNVVNHLSVADQRRALRALHQSLDEGGLLALGRSQDPSGETLGSIFERRGGSLGRLRELHGGSEHDALVDQVFRGSDSAAALP